MLDQIWNWFLDLTSKLVTPDWGALIALLPVGMAAVIVVWLVMTIRRFRGAPKARRGKTRIKPQTPAGIHMPGPSFSPFFAAIGVTLLFFGLVFGGAILPLGVLALVLTLLYWFAEGMRLYDHDVEVTAPTLPAVIHDGAPEGVHMPGPSFRPIIGALGMAILMFGLVFGGWLLLAGVLALIFTLFGWLGDAVGEYRQTVKADQTGHMENLPAPKTPSMLLTALGVLFIGGILLQTGILPPKSANGSTVAGAPASPGASGSVAPSGAPASGAPASPGPKGDISITAQGVAFLESAVTGPADKPFTIAFINQDAGTTHNVELKDATGAVAFKGEIFPGVASRVYDVPALKAGTYTFVCTVHSTMTGTLTIQ
jgi:plastocyanin